MSPATRSSARVQQSAAVARPALRRPAVRPGRILGLLAVVALVLVEVVPLLWLLMSSFKGPSEFATYPMWELPKTLHWQNYADAWTRGNMAVYTRNSLVATLPSVALLLVLSVAAGFGLEVLRWRGRNAVLLLLVGGLMIPLQMIILPLYTMYNRTQLLDTPASLIITYTGFGLPLTVFLMAGYFRSVPRELLEAAVVDGAGIYRSFFYIALPIVRNAMVTLGLVQFVFIWNDLMLSLIFINDDAGRTIQAGLLHFVDQYGSTEWGPTFASICLSTVPTLLLYLFLNQRILAGMTAGAVKG
jgi:raffinose/stachyose/melibiose transport system permease protein